MKIILINRKHGGSRSIELGRWSRALLSLCCLGLPLGMLQDDLDRQAEELAELRGDAQRTLQAMTLSLAEIQARMTRLDALGEHLTAMADLQDGEFDFSQPPALGGPIGTEFTGDFDPESHSPSRA